MMDFNRTVSRGSQPSMVLEETRTLPLRVSGRPCGSRTYQTHTSTISSLILIWWDEGEEGEEGKRERRNCISLWRSCRCSNTSGHVLVDHHNVHLPRQHWAPPWIRSSRRWYPFCSPPSFSSHFFPLTHLCFSTTIAAILTATRYA